MLAGIAALPVCAAAGYLTYQKLTDPHLLTYQGYGSTSGGAAWSPDGTRIASAGWQNGGIVQIWNATTGQTLQTCRTEQLIDGVYPLDIIWSADGTSVLAFVGWDSTVSLTPGDHIVEMVQIWNATTGQRIRSIPVMEPVTVNTTSSGPNQPLIERWALNERYLATAKSLQHTANQQGRTTLEIWNIATGNKIATLDAGNPGSASQVRSLAWSPDNEKLAIYWNIQDSANGQFFQVIDIWNIATGNKIATLDAWRQGPISNIANMVWSPDNERLALLIESADAMSYEVWNAPAGKRMQTFKPAGPNVYPIITWSPDGRYIATRTEVYDIQTGKRITTYPLQGMLESLAWSPDGSRVALIDAVKAGVGFSSISRTLSILDALSGRSIARYSGRGLFGNVGTNGKPVWSPNGKYVMVAGQNFDIWKGE